MHRQSVASGVSVAVYGHQAATGSGPLACVSFVSEGMTRLAQKDVVLTLPARVGLGTGSLHPEPFTILDMIAELAAQGRSVDVGSMTQFGARAPFGKQIVYARAQPMSGVPVGPEMLAVVLVSEEERQAVQAFGITRVLSRLGAASSWFPFPACQDPGRPSLEMAETFEQSILAGIHCKHVVGARVTQTGDAIWLMMPARPLPDLQSLAELAPQSPFALLTELDPAADACLLWIPGQTGPAAISPPGSTGASVGGVFLAVNGDQPADATQIFEDGFICSVTPATWRVIVQALLTRRPLAIRAANGLPLQVRWQ